MIHPLKVLARGAPDRLRYRPQPSWIPPMLATLSDDFPTEGKWVYEPKLDGVRAVITGATVSATVKTQLSGLITLPAASAAPLTVTV